MTGSFPSRKTPEASEYERRCLDEARRTFAGLEHLSGARAWEVRLEGEFPDTRLVIDYLDRRGVPATRSFAIWNEGWAAADGSPSEPVDFAGLAWALWDEDV